MGKSKRLKVHRQWLPGRSLCSIRSNRKWCKRRGSSLECLFVYTIIDSNLKNLLQSIVILTGEHLPLLHLLSDTLQAATLSVISNNAFITILSPALEIGVSTEILPLALISVCINRLTGVIIGLCSARALLILSKQFGCPLPL